MLLESAMKRAKSALAWAMPARAMPAVMQAWPEVLARLPAPVALQLEEALMGLVVAALPLLDVAEVGSGAQVAKSKDHH